MDPQFKKNLDDLLKFGRAADKIDKERAEVLGALMKTQGWQLYVELLTAKIQIYADAVLAPAGGVDNAVALEYIKGTMSGVILARDLPSVIVAAMKAAVPATDGENE